MQDGTIPQARSRAFAAINSERDYQDDKWGAATHELGAWILFMEHHLETARTIISTSNSPASAECCLAEIRKVTALGVRAMEQHGAPGRETSPSAMKLLAHAMHDRSYEQKKLEAFERQIKEREAEPEDEMKIPSFEHLISVAKKHGIDLKPSGSETSEPAELKGEEN